MTSSSIFAPPELKDRELFKLTTYLLDYISDTLVDPDSLVYDDLIFKVFTDYTDKEAVLAYYNLFTRPLVGTDTAMRFVLSILNIDARVIEWYDMDSVPFKFRILFNALPKSINVTNLVNLLFLLKNERSFLVSMGLDGCMDALVWDAFAWDESCYDDAFGVSYEGVRICFYENTEWGLVYDSDIGLILSDSDTHIVMYNYNWDEELTYDESPIFNHFWLEDDETLVFNKIGRNFVGSFIGEFTDSYTMAGVVSISEEII